MVQPLDLTRVNKTQQTLVINRNLNPLIKSVTNADSFLDEGILIKESINCCFFKSDKVFESSDTITLADYRLGYMMLPIGMYYIDYGDLDTFNLPDDKELENLYQTSKTNNSIFTPIIFKFRTEKNFKTNSNTLNSLHICNHIRFEAAPNPCGETETLGSHFHLFYYEGELFLPESKNKIDGKFFMIPIIFSEGLVVYYTIQKDETEAKSHLNRLLTMVLLSKQAKLWGIKSNLQYNDHLTIVVCTEIEPSFLI
jgi:hypothetical protein